MDCAPAVECLVTEDAPSPTNELGIKGGGEGGINTSVGAAIAGAIDDAMADRSGCRDRASRNTSADEQFLIGLFGAITWQRD